jgi:hypothetical protein
MATTTLNKEETRKIIHWGLPANGTEVTTSDFRAMIKEAEKGGRGITLEEHIKHTHEWLQKNL